MAHTFVELQGELHRIEARIRDLTKSDGFVEDLIALEKQRKEVLAELPCSQPESRLTDDVLILMPGARRRLANRH